MNVQIVAVNLQVMTITVESRPPTQLGSLCVVAPHMRWLAIPVFIEFGVTALCNLREQCPRDDMIAIVFLTLFYSPPTASK